jgi:hypothetical protein
MLVRGEFLRAGQLAYQRVRLVDQDGEVLRANPIAAALEVKLNQGDFLAGLLADQAFGLVFCHSSLFEIYFLINLTP